MHTRLERRFAHIRELDLEGFPGIVWYGGLKHRFPDERDSQEHFRALVSRVEAAVGREYLPIYRMADGEFEFLLGWRSPSEEAGSLLLRAYRRAHGGLRRARRLGAMRTCWGERYSPWQRWEGRRVLGASIRAISGQGILAPYFAVRPDSWGAQYFGPFGAWLDDNDVELGASNFTPFYFVYALLNGPRRRQLFDQRRILVATWADDQREAALQEALRRESAREVAVLRISRTGSLFDRLTLPGWAFGFDLVLVAAGIGSAHVICQLAPLRRPTIDSGISIECLLNPMLRLTRPFLCDAETYDALAGRGRDAPPPLDVTGKPSGEAGLSPPGRR